MEKRVLILEGSPRKKSNTAALCDSFVKGVEESSHLVERIFIREQTINGCLACGVCHTDAGSCIQQDDMKQVYRAIGEADVIVFSCPTYFCSWPAQFKAVLDRTYALEMTLAHKTFYLITTGEAPEESYLENMVNSYRTFIGCFQGEGIKNGGEIVGCAVTSADDVRHSKAAEKAYEMGKAV